MHIQLGDVVQLIKNERVLVREARAGYRLAALVLNRCGAEKDALVMTANALESLERLVAAVDRADTHEMVHASICLETRRRVLAGGPIDPVWTEAGDLCLMQADGPLCMALCELVPARIEARRDQADDGMPISLAVTGDDLTAAVDVATRTGANVAQLIALFHGVLPMIDLAWGLSSHETHVQYDRITRSGLGIVAPGITDELCGETVPLGEVGEVIADETPAADGETPA